MKKQAPLCEYCGVIFEIDRKPVLLGGERWYDLSGRKPKKVLEVGLDWYVVKLGHQLLLAQDLSHPYPDRAERLYGQAKVVKRLASGWELQPAADEFFAGESDFTVRERKRASSPGHLYLYSEAEAVVHAFVRGTHLRLPWPASKREETIQWMIADQDMLLIKDQQGAHYWYDDSLQRLGEHPATGKGAYFGPYNESVIFFDELVVVYVGAEPHVRDRFDLVAFRRTGPGVIWQRVFPAPIHEIQESDGQLVFHCNGRVYLLDARTGNSMLEFEPKFQLPKNWPVFRGWVAAVGSKLAVACKTNPLIQVFDRSNGTHLGNISLPKCEVFDRKYTFWPSTLPPTIRDGILHVVLARDEGSLNLAGSALARIDLEGKLGRLSVPPRPPHRLERIDRDGTHEYALEVDATGDELFLQGDMLLREVAVCHHPTMYPNKDEDYQFSGRILFRVDKQNVDAEMLSQLKAMAKQIEHELKSVLTKGHPIRITVERR